MFNRALYDNKNRKDSAKANKLLQTDAFEYALYGTVPRKWCGCLRKHYFF
jgi:hypothetical protein